MFFIIGMRMIFGNLFVASCASALVTILHCPELLEGRAEYMGWLMTGPKSLRASWLTWDWNRVFPDASSVYHVQNVSMQNTEQTGR